MDGQVTDEILLQQAKQEIVIGQQNAFEQILFKYEKLIYYVSKGYFNNVEDAKDVSQDVAVKIYNGLSNVTLTPGGNLKAWICTITARTCLDVLRKNKIQIAEYNEEIVKSTLPYAEEVIYAKERVQEILNGIQKLPKDQRMALVLRDIQGLSYEELAKILQINTGTVKSRLSRARAKLKEVLEKE